MVINQDTQKYNFYIIISLAKLISKEKSDLNGILCIVFLSNKCHVDSVEITARRCVNWCVLGINDVLQYSVIEGTG